MKTVFTSLLGLLLSVSLLQAAAFNKDAKFRSVKVHISSEKNLTVGNNTLLLKISKKSQPLDAKAVSVKIFMPAMPGMPAMESKAKAKALGKGLYEVKANMAMRGTWQMHIFITPKSGKKMRVKTSLNL